MRRRDTFEGRLNFFLPIGVLLAIAVGLLVPRPGMRDYERVSGFSVQRAMVHVRAVARQAHPVGSAADEDVRNYILQVLRGLPGEVSEQRASMTTHFVGRVMGANVTNLLYRIAGRDSRLPAIVLVAHHDSVATSPGASDNGAALAALLETARVLTTGSTLRRDLYLLFTDSEEFGLLGAQAFVREQTVAKRVGLVLNFEARGTRGAVLMVQTTSRNGELAKEFGRGATYPSANSLFSTLSSLLPNDSDVTAFSSVIPRALGFAFAEGLENYHRPTDSAAELDPDSLAQVGAYSIELARHFGELETLPSLSADAVYFDLWGRWLVVYSGKWAAAIGCFCLLIWVWLARRGDNARGAVARALRLGTQTIGVTLLCGLVIPAGFTALSALFMSPIDWIRYAPWIGLSALSVATGAVMLWHLHALRSADQQDLAVGTLGVGAILALLFGWFMPGASALWQWSTVATLCAWAWHARPGVTSPHWSLAIAVWMNALLTTPVVAMALRIGGPVLIPLPVLIGLLQFNLALPILTSAITKRSRNLSYGLVIAGVSLFIGSVGVAHAFSMKNSAALPSANGNHGPLVTHQPRQPSESVEVHRVREDAQSRTVEVRILPAVGVRCIALTQLAGPAVETLAVNAKPITHLVRFTPEIDEWGFRLMTGDRSARGYQFSYCAMGQEPLVLTLHVAGPGPVKLDYTMDLDDSSPTAGRGRGESAQRRIVL